MAPINYVEIQGEKTCTLSVKVIVFNIMLINVGNLDNVVYVMYRYGH